MTVGEVNPDWSDSDHVYIYMYGEQGQTGRRLLKHSLTNTAKIKQNQVSIAVSGLLPLNVLKKSKFSFKQSKSL